MFLQMLAKCADIFPKIYQHSFNQKLYAGTLSTTTFRSFLEQDKLYLCDFSESLLQISKQFDAEKNEANAKQFADLSLYVKEAELALHRDYLQDVQPFQFFQPKKPEIIKIPSITHYTEHLLQTTKSASVEEAVASVLPCFWIYTELGKQMDLSSCGEHHPYRQWIATYSDQEFVTKTSEMVVTLEKLALSVNCPEHQERIIESFEKSVTFELMFFDETMTDQRGMLSINEDLQQVACIHESHM